MKKKAIIVDIDGTITDLSHRLHYIRNPDGIKDSEKFCAEAYKDKPKQEVIDIITSLYENYTVIFLTGRPEKLREVTSTWLQNHIQPKIEYPILLMQPNNDDSNDDVFKQKIYEEEIKPKYDVVAVFDDRQRVVDMWRRIGLSCFQVEQWKE